MGSDLLVKETIIPGCFEIDLVVHSDSRGFFKENYQQAKLETLGLPHIEIKQNNISFNKDKGVIRGLHAEPWEKYVSTASGKVFGAWVDLRKGPTFGQILTITITPHKAVFVPRGVANGYLTLENNVVYTYLVNDHWTVDGKYQSVNAFDPSLGINWPISQESAIMSEKDSLNPMVSDINPMEF
ncbi:MAG: dTDP-4-dehydrorhamnose 3,5-epimerase family protein [Candidatus Saccharimonadales bacterium]